MSESFVRAQSSVEVTGIVADVTTEGVVDLVLVPAGDVENASDLPGRDDADGGHDMDAGDGNGGRPGSSVVVVGGNLDMTTQRLTHAAKQLARNMLDGAALVLRENGIVPDELTKFQILDIAANAQLSRFQFYGLLQKAPFVGSYIADADAYLKGNPQMVHATELEVMAKFVDVVNYSMEHYFPPRVLAETASRNASPVRIDPFSVEARACRERIRQGRFVRSKVKPFVATPTTMQEVLVEPFLTEAMAARIIHISEKTLADRRRAKKVDKSLYVQLGDDCAVLYYTVAWIEHNKRKPKTAELPELPVMTKNQVISGKLPPLPKQEVSREKRK